MHFQEQKLELILFLARDISTSTPIKVASTKDKFFLLLQKKVRPETFKTPISGIIMFPSLFTGINLLISKFPNN